MRPETHFLGALDKWAIAFRSCEMTQARLKARRVPNPRNYEVPMPPKGGAPLSDSDVAAVAAYVWAISHRKG